MRCHGRFAMYRRLGNMRGWQALRNPNYRLYFFGQLVSQTGAWLQRVAQAWLVLDLTGSPAALGFVTALQFLPITVFSLVAGVLADRLPKRRMLLILQVVATFQASAFALLTLSGSIQLWHVYVLAFILGVVNAFEMPIRQTLAGQLVSREELQSAIGLNSSVFNAARILGPGIGGIIIAAWGVGWCFGLNALSYFGVVISLLLLRMELVRAYRRSPTTAVWHQLADGLRYVAHDRALAHPLLLAAFIGTFGYNFSVGLPLLARYALGLDAVGFGSLNVAMGIGSLVGALALAAWVTPSRPTLLAAGGSFSGLLLGLAFSPSYSIALLLLVGMGLASVTYSAVTNTTLQLRGREEYRGRVLSLYTLLFAGTTPLGGAITGSLADAWGIRAALALEALVCLVAIAGAGWWARRLE
jgi:MFS family permease